MESRTKETLESSTRNDVTMELDEMAPLNTERSEQADGTSDPEDEDAEQLLHVSLGI